MLEVINASSGFNIIVFKLLQVSVSKSKFILCI